MASKATASSSEPKITLEELMEKGYEHLISKIRQLRKKIEAGRHKQVEEKLDKSGKMLQNHTHELLSATCMTNSSAQKNSLEVPHLGVESALCVLDGFPTGEVDTDLANIHEIIDVNSTKLPKVQRIPSYTTWLFLDRNQRMAEDQSVVGRRRIYYDQFENEALICSDSEDDIADIEEEKREFSDGEDQILSMALREYGLNKDVADVVSHFIGGSSSEILERYNDLKLKSQVSNAQGSTERNVFLEKSLSAALDSFENLFCRRCLVFDCRLHGCFQSVVYPSEKQLCGPESQDRKPCSDQCYLRAGQTVDNPVEISNGSSLDQIEGETSVPKVLSSKNKKDSGSGDRMCNVEPKAEEGPTRGVPSAIIDLSTDTHTYVGKRKTIHDHREELEKTDSFADSFEKKQKKIQSAEASTVSDEEVSATAILSSQTRFSNSKAPAGSISQLIDKHFLKGTSRRSSHNFGDELCVFSERLALEQSTASFKARRKGLLRSSKWKPLEKDLYVKGLEIFGKNSCLIARNLLSGLKTCTEVFNYMRENGAVKTQNKDSVRCLEDRAGADTDNMEQDILMRPRSKLFRKRGRRLKYSSKSNGHPSRRKRINNNENRPCKQYSPCTCQSTCGKDCSCAKVGNCCEKYCGCPKSCKNRFRGCHCAKSQCRSRQCPCFAANRECDPDVCRNCWVSCGGGSLGEPVKKGDGQCGNMRLLLRQQKRVLLGRSDVSGWGAFIKDAVNKNDYLGEYTGELVSHREADKRGKMYDRANSSFLFDLNDQYVLDAYRHGDKLKFANHSLKPNCYCKVVLVKGDHRIGIFAKERIDAKEELFYDYCYGPDQAPEWARKPGSSKKEDSLASQGRARKHQSR